MSLFADRPLGAAIPDSPHAVSVSLPTMRSVRGYEEKDPEITGRMRLGYPRFVVHPFAAELAATFAGRFAGRKIWLVSSAGMAGQLTVHLNAIRDGCALAFEDGGAHGVAHLDDRQLVAEAKLFLQHVGGFVSSRQAEDQLVRRGLRPAAAAEPTFAGDAAAAIRQRLLPAVPGAEAEDVVLTPSGANAIYAAYRAVADVQGPRGRTEWIQLGWLYLDSIAVLKKFSGAGAYHHLPDVFDLSALERLLAARGREIAGLVTEIPTNPLIQTPDVAALAALCRRHGVRLILDPSVSSMFNVQVLPHADLVASSLTKYTASEGDVIAGAVVVNRNGADADALRGHVAHWAERVYARDLGRLAAQIGRTSDVVARINAATPQVAAFLASHPGVSELYWAWEERSRQHYRQVQAPRGGPGGMISFVVKGELARFYDRLRLAKGPSFGMTTTLICPFMYLAHYDLITSEAGRAELAANRLHPDLLRLCIGTEPVEDIAALAEALS